MIGKGDLVDQVKQNKWNTQRTMNKNTEKAKIASKQNKEKKNAILTELNDNLKQVKSEGWVVVKNEKIVPPQQIHVSTPNISFFERCRDGVRDIKDYYKKMILEEIFKDIAMRSEARRGVLLNEKIISGVSINNFWKKEITKKDIMRFIDTQVYWEINYNKLSYINFLKEMKKGNEYKITELLMNKERWGG